MEKFRDPLADLTEAPRQRSAPEPAPVLPPQGADAAPESGNVRFDQMLAASGLSPETASNVAKIFRAMDEGTRVKIMDAWPSMLPSLAQADRAYRGEVAQAAGNYLATMLAWTDGAALRKREMDASEARRQAEIAQGVALSDQARADQVRAAQLAKIRGVAAAPSGEPPAPQASDPLAAFG